MGIELHLPNPWSKTILFHPCFYAIRLLNRYTKLKLGLFLCWYVADVMFPHHIHQIYVDIWVQGAINHNLYSQMLHEMIQIQFTTLTYITIGYRALFVLLLIICLTVWENMGNGQLYLNQLSLCLCTTNVCSLYLKDITTTTTCSESLIEGYSLLLNFKMPVSNYKIFSAWDKIQMSNIFSYLHRFCNLVTIQAWRLLIIHKSSIGNSMISTKNEGSIRLSQFFLL